VTVMVAIGEVGVVVMGRQHLLFVDDAKSSVGKWCSSNVASLVPM
jgi:hypothetical protein